MDNGSAASMHWTDERIVCFLFEENIKRNKKSRSGDEDDTHMHKINL
jgi:hypothetical protein